MGVHCVPRTTVAIDLLELKCVMPLACHKHDYVKGLVKSLELLLGLSRSSLMHGLDRNAALAVERA